MNKRLKTLIACLLSLFVVLSFEACGNYTAGNTQEQTTGFPSGNSSNEGNGEQKYFTVSFYDESGTSNIETQRVKQGEKALKPETPKDVATLDGTIYRFIGWYLNDQEFDFNTVIDNDTVIVIKWSKEKNSVDIPI